MLMAHKTEAGWDVLISAGWICRYSTHPVHTSVPHCPYHVSCTCTHLDMQVFNAPCTSVPHSLPWTRYPVPCTLYLDSGCIRGYSTHLLPLLHVPYTSDLCTSLHHISHTLCTFDPHLDKYSSQPTPQWTYHLYIQAQSEYGELVCHVASVIQGVSLHWASPKKLKYGKPRLGESTLT